MRELYNTLIFDITSIWTFSYKIWQNCKWISVISKSLVHIQRAAVYFFASLSREWISKWIQFLWCEGEKSLWNCLLTFILLVIISYIFTTNSVQKIYFYICNKFVIKNLQMHQLVYSHKTLAHILENALVFCNSHLIFFVWVLNAAKWLFCLVLNLCLNRR